MNQRTNTARDIDSHLKQFQMQYLSRQSSRKHMEMQEQFLERTLSKQSSKMLRKSKPKLKNSMSKEIVKPKQTFSHEQSDRKKLTEGSDSTNKKIAEFNVEDEYLKDIDNYKVSRKFEFSIISYCFEVVVAYGLAIGLFFLIQAGQFPYFQILFVFGLMNSISPWSSVNIVVLIAAFIIIANKYLFVEILTYPSILIVYFSVALFNEQYKIKAMFIFVLALVFAFGFALIPGIYDSFADDNKFSFYYVFPILMFLLRTIISSFYVVIGFSEYIYLQVPLFLMGLDYGVILTVNTSSIEYWYLMVLFTLQVINERTQFTLKFLVSAVNSCNKSRVGTAPNSNSEQQIGISILHSHASGYSCLHSLHIICFIYFLAYVPLYSSPYTYGTCLRALVHQTDINDGLFWYLPLVTWILVEVYEIMSLVLLRKKRNKLLFGFTDNGKLQTLFRTLMLVIGLWMFYLGLGIGNQLFFPNFTRDQSNTQQCILNP